MAAAINNLWVMGSILFHSLPSDLIIGRLICMEAPDRSALQKTSRWAVGILRRFGASET
jgi:hypothetical protein